jgi:Putative zinc-finger
VSDDYCRWDAAYVLGALPPSERREFEAHLADCATCQRSLRELAGLPSLMADVRLEDLEAAPSPPPPTLLPTLVRAVRRERNRSRWTGALVAVAAAVTLAVATLGVGHLVRSTTGSDKGVAMSPVAATPIHAQARLTAKSWGTQIDLVCTYDTHHYGHATQTYALLVTNRAGATQRVGTWKVVPGRPSVVSGAVGWSRADIAKVEIRTAAGSPVLRLRV